MVMDEKLYSSVLMLVQGAKTISLDSVRTLGKDFFKLNPLEESLLHRARRALGQEELKVTELKRKAIILEAFSFLKNAKGLSFYIVEENPKLFYPKGETVFLPLTVPTEGIYAHGQDVFAFNVELTRARHYKIRNADLTSTICFPIKRAGSILEFKGNVKESFFVVMGDHLSDIRLKKLMESHRKSKAVATIALTKQEMQLEYGIVELEGNDIAEFSEKPRYEFFINTGIYAFEPEIFGYIKEKDDFAKQVFPRLLTAKKKINSFVFDEYWVDVGRVGDYERLNEFIKVTTLVSPTHG